MFRRRLMRQTGIFLLGSLAFPYISQIYPPLDLDLILVFFGLIFFGALILAIVLERRARNHQEIELMKRVYNGFIPLPWILAATLFVNGRLDSQKNVVYYPTVVVGRFNMKGIVKGSRRLVVRSWREGQRVERLAVDMDDFDRFHEGDAIVVGVGPGALAIPWYYGCTGADPGRLINMRACGWPALGAGYRDSCRFCRNGNGPVPLDRRHALSIRMFLRADWERRRETTLRFLPAPSP